MLILKKNKINNIWNVETYAKKVFSASSFLHSKIKKEKRTVKKEKKTSKLNFISHFLKISIILSQVVKLIKEKLYMISILQYFFITKEVKKWLKGEFNDL